MIKKFSALLALAFLSACQTAPAPATITNPTWVSSTTKDEFTDVVTKMVSTGSFSYKGRTLTQVGKYYPFVGTKGSVLYVGVRSGGLHRIPTGTIQIRIDDYPAWTITPEETPADLVPGTVPAAAAPAGVSAEMMANMSKLMSPYTAATADKAKEILKQMLSGKVIRYRTVGLNQAASTTGEAAIDKSFFDSLRDIGVNPDAL